MIVKKSSRGKGRNVTPMRAASSISTMPLCFMSVCRPTWALINTEITFIVCVLFTTDVRTCVPKLSGCARRGRQRSKLNSFGCNKDRWVVVTPSVFTCCLGTACLVHIHNAVWRSLRKICMSARNGYVLVQMYKTKWLRCLCAYIQRLISSDPFAYAYWGFHVEGCNANSKLVSIGSNFLSSMYIVWPP